MSAKDPNARLGRGLAALMGETESRSEAAESVRELQIDDLDAGPYQPRSSVDEASLIELAASIRTRGLLQPLLVRPSPLGRGRFQIIAGERRWRAAQKAGMSSVPALVRELSDFDAMAAGLVENLQRQDLNAMEEAEGYRRLTEEFNLTQEALGHAVGKSRSHIANTMRLLNLPNSVQAEVRKGVLSAGHARALLSHKEPEKAALAVISRGLNVRQTEALGVERARPAAPPPKAPETEAIEHELSERLGLRVDLVTSGTSGSLRIYFRTLDQLDGLIQVLTPRH